MGFKNEPAWVRASVEEGSGGGDNKGEKRGREGVDAGNKTTVECEVLVRGVTYNSGRRLRLSTIDTAHENKGSQLRLLELEQDGVNGVEGCVNLLSDLRGNDGSATCSITTRRGGVEKGMMFTFAPVRTILPETKMRSTTLGLSMR